MNQSTHGHSPLGYSLAVISTLLWAGNFIIARGLSEQIPPVGLAFWRWVTATVALAPFALSSLIADWHSIRRHGLYLAVTALLGITIFNTLIYIAGHSTQAINLSVITASFPFFIVILARLFYKEPITPAKAVGLTVAVLGVLILITKGSVSTLREMTFAIGDIWVLIGALSFAGYSILIKRKPPDIRTRSFLLITFFLGTLFLLPFYLWERRSGQPIIWTPAVLMVLAYVGVLASLIAFFTWNKAIELLGPSRTAILYYLTPLFSSLAAALFLGETIAISQALSLGLIVAGILIANARHMTPEPKS